MILLFLPTPELPWERRGRATPLAEKVRWRRKGDTGMQGCPCPCSQSTALTLTHCNKLPVCSHNTHLVSSFSIKLIFFATTNHFLMVQLMSKVLYHVSQSHCTDTFSAHSKSAGMQDGNVPFAHQICCARARNAIPVQWLPHRELPAGLGSAAQSVGAFCSVMDGLDIFCIMVLGVENARISGTGGTYLKLHSADYTNGDSMGFRLAAWIL